MLKFAFSAVFLLVLAIRHVKDPGARGRFDATFLGMLAIVLLFPFIPFSSVKSFAAGGVTISLDGPSVQAAVSTISRDPRISEDLRRRLESYQSDLTLVPGARILWIDKDPLTMVGAQRLLRALGASIVVTTSTRSTEGVFQSDVDFDLIISDVVRRGDSWRTLQRTPADSVYEGFNFVRLLRAENRCAVADIPVVFYSGLPLARLERDSEDLRGSLPQVEVTDNVPDLVVKVVRMIARTRRAPFVYSARKTPVHSDGACPA